MTSGPLTPSYLTVVLLHLGHFFLVVIGILRLSVIADLLYPRSPPHLPQRPLRLIQGGQVFFLSFPPRGLRPALTRTAGLLLASHGGRPPLARGHSDHFLPLCASLRQPDATRYAASSTLAWQQPSTKKIAATNSALLPSCPR